MARRQLTLQDAGYPYLVAERDGSVPGYAYAGPYRARPAYRHTVENSVCEARGFRQMIAVIGGSDHAASIRLHVRDGFVPIGVLKDVGYSTEAGSTACSCSGGSVRDRPSRRHVDQATTSRGRSNTLSTLTRS